MAAGIPVIVGTAAVNSASAVAHAARHVGCHTARAFQGDPVRRTRPAGGDPRQPSYGIQTKATQFRDLRRDHPNLGGFNEIGGAAPTTNAAEHITSGDPDVVLMVGADTCVFHRFVKRVATGAITGIGNALPRETLHFMALAQAAATGDVTARRRAQELGAAFEVLARSDTGADLVLYFKHLMVPQGDLSALPGRSVVQVRSAPSASVERNIT